MNICVCQADAGGKFFVIKVVDDATGFLAPGFDSIVISLSDLANADATVRRAKFQWLRWKDADNSCAPMRAKVLMTDPEPDTP